MSGSRAFWPLPSLWRGSGAAGMEAGGGSGWLPAAPAPGFLQKIFRLSPAAPSGNATCLEAFCQFPEMWYGVFLWALVSSLLFHIPAGLLALFTLWHHKYGRFMSVSILLMGIVGPITAGTLTSAAIAGVYRAAGKEMIPFIALMFGVGQSCCVVIISFSRILATL